MSKFVIRFDDISPEMNWDNFNKLRDVILDLAIKPIIGVIPQCKDEKLRISPAKNDFWDEIRHLKKSGWTVAQHGYTHQYTTLDSGLLKINQRSEFSGLSYESQLEKINKGKKILVAEKVWQPVFMAPAHSFDKNTLSALDKLDFLYITDGYGIYSYDMGNLKVLPSLFSSPKHLGLGVYTICLHTNSMSDAQINMFIKFIKDNKKNIISFNEGLKIQPLPIIDLPIRILTTMGLRTLRMIKRKLRG